MFRIRGALTLLVLLCAAPAGAQSIASLFTSLPEAASGILFTPSNAIILGAGGAASAVIHPEDLAQRSRNGSGRTPAGASTFAEAGAPIGNGITQSAVALGTYIVGRAAHSASIGAFGADLVDAQIVNGVLTQGIKLSVRRTRPDGSSDWNIGTATFATAAVIERHYGWTIAAPFYALGAYVSTSRLVDNQHWASDLFFGAALGIVSGRAVSVGHGAHRVRVSPAALPRGVGFSGSIGN